jgi:pimeloyl-ACP methyl ester carboxylesterase
VRVVEQQAEIDGLGVAWREAAGPGAGASATLYVHGVPNSSVMWTPFLERTGGVALDLPGFGSSDKPADFPYSLAGYGHFIERFLEQLGLARVTLVAHDWGGAALVLAQRRPELIDRLVVISCVPLVAGYRWHRFARAWRRPLVGELLMGVTFRWALKLVSREASARDGPLPDGFIDEVWRHFDHGTQRAILKLYRSASEDQLARAGSGLAAVRAPALVLWGEKDPYLPSELAERHARALGGPARVELLEDAGHWPWLDRPEVLDVVAGFVAGGDGPG